MSNTHSNTAINWEIGPIFRAMLRNKVGAILIALQINNWNEHRKIKMENCNNHLSTSFGCHS